MQFLLDLRRRGIMDANVLRAVDEVPREPHDVPMTHALTPGRGLIELGGG